MGSSLALEIGTTVRTDDGLVGRLVRVILESKTRRVTHVVVKPNHGHDVERLVPIELCSPGSDGVTLNCTSAEFARFEPGVESETIRLTPDAFGDVSSSFAYPFLDYTGPSGRFDQSRVITNDRIPFGEVEIRGGTHVHAADGRIGTLCGVMIDPETHVMSHLLLEEGHLWTQREVALPSEAVSKVGNGAADVSWPKAQIKSLSPVDVDRAIESNP
jgi:sporulation protein YlmC with PRC-barrel domain